MTKFKFIDLIFFGFVILFSIVKTFNKALIKKIIYQVFTVHGQGTVKTRKSCKLGIITVLKFDSKIVCIEKVSVYQNMILI